MSQRGRSQGGRSSQGGPASEVNVEQLAEKAVNFILAYAAHKAPIKHVDLKKFVFPDSRIEEPLRLAKKMLNDTFGYDLLELPSKSKAYILVNKLVKQDHISLSTTVCDKNYNSVESYHILLSLILAYIFMARKEVEIKNLLKYLQNMDINIDRFHPYFGNVAELLLKENSGFIKDQYLSMTVNEQGTFYDWGPRAKLEVKPREVLELVSEMLGKDISCWHLHIKDAEKMEAEAS